MKRIWIAIALFVFILGCCITESIIVGKMVDDLYQNVEKIQSMAKEKKYDDAIKLSKEIDDKWQQEDNKLGVFISHETLDELEQELTVLKINLRCGEYNDFWAESGRVLAILQQLKDTELPSLSNIL